MGLLFGMPSLVFIKIRWITEFPWTFLAFKRSIPRMDPNMNLQAAGAEKRFGAMFTAVFSLPCMLH
jgi:hypothetical protein